MKKYFEKKSRLRFGMSFITSLVRRDSPVGIATRYGLHGPGIESRWWRSKSGADHPPPPKCRGQERIRLYLCFTFWASGACSKENLTSPYYWITNMEVHCLNSTYIIHNSKMVTVPMCNTRVTLLLFYVVCLWE